MITAPIIEQNNQSAQFEALEGLIPNAQYEEKTGLEGVPESITGIFVDKNGGGAAIVFTATSSYSSEPMKYAVGIDADGKILAIKKITYMESKDFGNYPESFVGKEYAGIDSVVAFSGVTYSSNAFKAGLKDAFAAYYAAMGGELKETEIDVLNKLVEGLTFAELTTEAKLDAKITAAYIAGGTTYAYRYEDEGNIYLVVSDLFGNVLASAVYEGAEGATVPTDFVADATKEVVATEIIGKVLEGTTEFENVQTEATENTAQAEIAYTGTKSFTAKSLAVFKTENGYAVLVEADGYASVANKGEKMILAVGFDNEGKIAQTTVISHGESSNFGKDKVVENKEHTDKYLGLEIVPESSIKFALDDHAFATYTFAGYHNGMRVAYLAYQAVISE